MIIILYSILGSTSASAQNLAAKAIVCNSSKWESNAQARYECFIKKRTGSSLEHAKELAATRLVVLEAKEKLRFELNESPKKERKKINRQEIMQQVEYSRSRNISHKGERYSITYGYVLELRP
ncbi:MAG: hypothetical protein VYD14_02505 [SAR324 cluster bacterium]|nr:hypothetical protein [SAR324 cluster bacterium]